MTPYQHKLNLGSDREREFDTRWKQLAPEPFRSMLDQTEHRFHPPRRWQFDRAAIHPEGGGVAVEIEGGSSYGSPVTCHRCRARVRALRRDGSPGKELRIGGRHSHVGRGFESDVEKYNAAAAAGWLLIRVTPKALSEQPVEIVAAIVRAMALKFGPPDG